LEERKKKRINARKRKGGLKGCPRTVCQEGGRKRQRGLVPERALKGGRKKIFRDRNPAFRDAKDKGEAGKEMNRGKFKLGNSFC